MDRGRSTDEALLGDHAGPQAGASFGALYRRYAPLVVAFHMRRVRDPEVAADLTSETFAQALVSRHRFIAQGEGSAARWLFTIAAHVYSHHVRRAGAQRRATAKLGIVRPSLDDAQLERIVEAGSDSQVVAALDALPELQREAVRAYVLGDEDYDEIAGRVDASAVTVRKRVSRGLAALRGAIEESR